MATTRGREGIIKVGANTVAETRSWTLDESADTVDSSVLGTQWKTKKDTMLEWSGSAECWWDATDTNGQESMTIGAEVTLNFYPEGDSAGDVYYTGSAIVTGRSTPVAHDNLVERSFTFEGNGALTETSV